MSSILQIQGLSHSFGGRTALDQLSFQLEKGESLALMGPNGSGKSTTLNCISGFYVPEQGTIRFQNQLINGKRPDQIAQMGLSRTFQQPQLFSGLTVRQHLQLAQHVRRPSLRSSSRIDYWLERCELRPFAEQYPEQLSYGTQKRLALARCFASEAQLILLDEAAAGLNQAEQLAFIELIRQIRSEQSLSLLLVEHQISVIKALAERVLVLHNGSKIAEGSFAEIQEHPLVKEIYFGS